MLNESDPKAREGHAGQDAEAGYRDIGSPRYNRDRNDVPRVHAHAARGRLTGRRAILSPEESSAQQLCFH